uniref:Macaca fascicularis brain cDNA clone: QflA-22118, similar to human kinectin 1 (kinesin receptor) (KTN1), mRNA, RefSeq: NM_182926.1 n=1 Tax=Macaca fascicularis TaxID=9541 RepID=I7GMH1_MACFA|nr:unnamed protein product [Macaca fascicularis]
MMNFLQNRKENKSLFLPKQIKRKQKRKRIKRKKSRMETSMNLILRVYLETLNYQMLWQ